MSWDDISKPILTVFDFILFFVLTLVFVPAFLIVTYLQEYWSKKLSELFGL